MYRHFGLKKLRLAECKRKDFETDVVSGLSITPARMQQLTRDGVPINSQANAASYDDGYRTLDYEPAMDLQRGVDIAELWENNRDIKDRMRQYYHKHRPLDGAIAHASQKGGE